MATTKAKAVAAAVKEAPVADVSALEYVESAMRIYGMETNLDRAVPDFRDGCKPVYRRILWAMASNGLVSSSREIKSARIVGDTIGKLHPHGDTSAYGALITLANVCTPPVDGIGNWGTLIDGAAAYRYTNARFTEVGKLLFHKYYFPAVSKVPNFDHTWKEPLILPSLLPTLLFNGASGIGVGLSLEIPAFTPTSVLKLMIRILQGEKPTPEDFAKGLHFYSQYGGRALKTKATLPSIIEFMGSTSGAVVWECDLEVLEEQKQIHIKGFCPEVRPLSLIEDKIKPMVEVQSVHPGDGLSYIVQVNKKLNMNDFRKVVDKVKKLTTRKVTYDIYVTERNLKEGFTDRYETKLLAMSIPQLFVRWLRWRISLEKESLNYRISEIGKKVELLSLLILACSNLPVIFKALQSEDPAAAISKGLKITVDQANVILDRKVRQLSKMDNNKLELALKEAKATLKDLHRRLSDPKKEVLEFMERALPMFEPKEIYAGTTVWLADPKVARSLIPTMGEAAEVEDPAQD